MTRSGKSSLLFLFLIFTWSYGMTQNIFNAKNSKKFARYLFNTQQFELAATEYERILTIDQSDTSVFSGLLETYRLGNLCEKSFNNLRQFEIEHYFTNRQVANGYLKLAITCNCCFDKNNFSKALSSINHEKRVFYELGN